MRAATTSTAVIGQSIVTGIRCMPGTAHNATPPWLIDKSKRVWTRTRTIDDSETVDTHTALCDRINVMPCLNQTQHIN